MLEARVKIINQLGLHARAAAQLVRMASKYKSRISLVREDNAVFSDAKSILSVLTLAASKGTEIKLEVAGDDEQAALQAISDLFANGFGEL
ncbi:MAG: phosphocarrier protein HPr [Acidobacteria bacterium]|jgi:phosphocarrier protein HPr|nr:phosphocarrier protein HPr [Acidobacteriota bacterium]